MSRISSRPRTYVLLDFWGTGLQRCATVRIFLSNALEASFEINVPEPFEWLVVHERL